MAEPKKQQSDTAKIARERLLWVLQPFILVCIVSWWLHPSTTQPDNLERSVLAGFLLGAGYCLFLYRDVFTVFFAPRTDQMRRRKNRLPEEYYFGKVKEILFSQEGGGK